MMNEEEVVKLRGLPWTCTMEDIVDFFSPECRIKNGLEGVHMVKTPEGRATGEAFVELNSEEDLEAAVKKDRKNMGHRYIEVFKVKKSEMDWILKRARPNQAGSNGSSFRGGSGGGGYDECGGSETYVRLRGIPYECTKEDIANFFAGLEVAPNGIQMVVDGSGRTTGEAYTQFTSVGMVEEALQRDRQCIGHRYVELFRVSPSEMRTIDMLVERTNRHFSSRPGPYDRPNRDGGGGGGRFGGGGGGGPQRGGRYFDRGNNGGGRYADDSWNNYANEVGNNWNRGGGGGGGGGGPTPLIPGLRGRFGGGGGGGGGGGRGQMNSNMMGGYSVLMRGLPFRATENDIRMFFHPLCPRGVNIIFDDSNRPSGTAKVYFASQDDVALAMGKHKERMEHRYIELFAD